MKLFCSVPYVDLCWPSLIHTAAGASIHKHTWGDPAPIPTRMYHYCAISCKTNSVPLFWSGEKRLVPKEPGRRHAIPEKQLLSSGPVPRPLWHLPGQQAYFPWAWIPTDTSMVTEPAPSVLSSEPWPINNNAISSLRPDHQ